MGIIYSRQTRDESLLCAKLNFVHHRPFWVGFHLSIFDLTPNSEWLQLF